MRVLRLVPVGLDRDDLDLLAWLGAAIHACLPLAPVQDAALALDPAWRDASGQRVSSNRVVDALIERSPASADGVLPTDWTLALTAEDLSAPGRDFVHGEAAQGGAWAVVSLARTRDHRPLLLTEALHELGHLADLRHCDDPRCAMAPVALRDSSDPGGTRYCPGCSARVQSALDPSAPAS